MREQERYPGKPEEFIHLPKYWTKPPSLLIQMACLRDSPNHSQVL